MHRLFQEIYTHFETTETVHGPHPHPGFHEIQEFQCPTQSSLYRVIPQEIRIQEIETHLYRHFVWDFTVGNTRQIHVFLDFPQESESKSKIDLEDIQRRVCLIVNLMHTISISQTPNTNCSKDVCIFLILTPHLKQLPSDSTQELDVINVNTAFTFTCKEHNEIVIFRQEEWSKVLFHELFHTLGLDFSGASSSSLDALNHTLKSKIYPGLDPKIRDLRPYEAFCETWARVLHSILEMYIQKKHYDSWIQVELPGEIQWSLGQARKILKYQNEHGFTYQDLVSSSSSVYRESSKTSVFSYYVLTAVLLSHLDQVLEWSRRRNTKNSSLLPSLVFPTPYSKFMKRWVLDLILPIAQDKSVWTGDVSTETTLRMTRP